MRFTQQGSFSSAVRRSCGGPAPLNGAPQAGQRSEVAGWPKSHESSITLPRVLKKRIALGKAGSGRGLGSMAGQKWETFGPVTLGHIRSHALGEVGRLRYTRMIVRSVHPVSSPIRCVIDSVLASRRGPLPVSSEFPRLLIDDSPRSAVDQPTITGRSRLARTAFKRLQPVDDLHLFVVVGDRDGRPAEK